MEILTSGDLALSFTKLLPDAGCKENVETLSVLYEQATLALWQHELWGKHKNDGDLIAVVLQKFPTSSFTSLACVFSDGTKKEERFQFPTLWGLDICICNWLGERIMEENRKAEEGIGKMV